MIISATIKNSEGKNAVVVETGGYQKELDIPAKVEGLGVAVNGGELLFLALATCYCNDVYREAAKRNIKVNAVEVSVSGTFGKEGDPASNIGYQVHIDADCSQEEIADLIEYVDKVAEVHNTLRNGVSVDLLRK